MTITKKAARGRCSNLTLYDPNLVYFIFRKLENAKMSEKQDIVGYAVAEIAKFGVL